MRKSQSILLLIVFACLVKPLQAQNPKEADSLLRLISSTGLHDTVKVAAYIKLGQKFETIGIDTAMFYYRQALQLAKSPALTSLPKQEAKVLENIGFAYIYSMGDYSTAMRYMWQALRLHQNSGNLSEAAKTHYNIGFFWANIEAYDSAICHYQKVIEANKQLAHPTRLHESYNNMGMAYYYQRSLGKAAYYLIQAAEIKEQTREIKEIHHTYMNIGIIFKELGEYKRARKYFEMSGRMSKQLKQPKGYALSLKNTADCYAEEGRIEEATKLYEQAKEIYEAEESQFGLASYYLSMAIIAQKKGKYEKAEQWLLQSASYPTKVLGDRMVASIFCKLAEVQSALADSLYADRPSTKIQYARSATEYANKGWQSALKSTAKDKQLQAATILSQLYTNTGDYEQALFFSERGRGLSEEINRDKQEQAIANTVFRYETDKVEAENSLLKQLQRTKDAQLKQQKTLNTALGGIAVLLAVLAGVVYVSRKKVLVANQLIEESLKGKELLLKEIHHRVKNNLQIVSSLLELQAREIEDEKVLSVFSEGKGRVKAMGIIHQRLYQHDNLSRIEFLPFTQQLLQELGNSYDPQGTIQYQVDADANLTFDIDTAIPLGLIMNELISNAYKYAFESMENGKLKVQLTSGEENDNVYRLSISDNGIGISGGLDLRKAKGFGLRLVHRLTRQLGGKVEYKRDQENRFEVTFNAIAPDSAVK